MAGSSFLAGFGFYGGGELLSSFASSVLLRSWHEKRHASGLLLLYPENWRCIAYYNQGECLESYQRSLCSLTCVPLLSRTGLSG